MASTQGLSADVAVQLERVQRELLQAQREREDEAMVSQAEIQDLGQQLVQVRAAHQADLDRATADAQAQLQLEKDTHKAEIYRLDPASTGARNPDTPTPKR